MKKKLWITSLLAALSIGVVAGGTACVAAPNKVITKAEENWTVATEIDNKYLYGTSFEVPAAQVEVNGQTVSATATVTYPNGLTVNTASVPLNQAGEYTITYRAVVGDIHCLEERTFIVESKGYLVQSEGSSVEYGTYTKYKANSEGLLVRLAANDSLTFSKLIDFNALTGEDALVEFFITPDAQGVYDFNTLVFTFTDAMDDSIYLRYQMKRYPAEDRGINWGYVDVGGNGQEQVGCENGVHRSGWVGTPISFTFCAAMHEGNQWWGTVVERQPDIDKCRLFFNPQTMEATTNGSHIAHLNNLEYYENAWNGFPSGQARLTITALDVQSETANFCITKFLGMEDLSQNTFTESGAPMIEASMTQEEMPNGMVNYSYKIPAATAYDYYSGACEVKTSVYRDYASDSPISVGVSNGTFKPMKAGWYTIEYTAADALGNVGKALRNIYVAENLGDIQVTLPENAVTETTLGTWLPFGAAEYTGDCGLANVKITATLGEETYEVTDGFRPEIAGEWKITYTVTDYIGREGKAEYTLNATIGSGYVALEEPILPKIFISDSAYTLPLIYATDYSSGKAEQKVCSVVVTDKNGDVTYTAGDTFKPSVAANGDMVTVSYQYDGQVLVVKEVPTIIGRGSGNKIIGQNYLYGEGFTTSFKDDKDTEDEADDEFYSAGIEVIAKERSELCGWTFANPQMTDNFKITFEGIKDKANFDALQITLTDSKNDSEQISILLKVGAKNTTVVVGDLSADVMSISLNSNQQYSVGYNAGKFTFGSANLVATTTTNGEAFEGFSSNLAYVSVAMVNAKAGASYKFLSVNEANISRRNLEVFAPNFKILGNFGGNQSLNTVYEIFPAMANDAFAPNTSLTLTVTGPDGSIITDKNGLKLENVATDKTYYIDLTAYGKYQITYTAKEEDWVAQNVLSMVKTVFVIDEAAPQVQFVGEKQTTAKVGDTVSIPTFVYQDNVSANENMIVTVSVLNPYGRMYRFEEGETAIKCIYEGEYKFIIMVMDEHGNMSYLTHTVTVSLN